MISNSESTALAELNLDSDGNFIIGLRELLFLATIFFFGFCGFTVCVDKIYSVSENQNEIESIMVHGKDLSAVGNSIEATNYLGYSLSLENR